MRTARFTRTITSTNTLHEHTHQPHRSLSTILEIIDHAPIADSVKAQASRAFQLLGEAEARIHSMPIEEVHFHEVGAVDTIVDIVCSAVGCAHLGVDRWLASSLNVGSGTVDCAHGTLPVPAPATLALLADAPVYAAGPPMERVTPTGAAILRMLDVRVCAAAGDASFSFGIRRRWPGYTGSAESGASACRRRRLTSTPQPSQSQSWRLSSTTPAHS